MVFMLPGYYNQPYAASLHKSFNDNYDEVFREDSLIKVEKKQRTDIDKETVRK